jgi:flagella basal body P-ring formation protein FlgA
MKGALTLILAARAFACQAVEGDHITGKDLAAANPAFASIDPNLAIGEAPLAGVRRILRAQDLAKIARENRIAAPAPFADLCFERVTESLTAEELLPVLRSALNIEGAGIEILDYGRYPVPRGTLEFTRAGLTATGLWRGRIVYAEGRSAPVWAKVRVTVERTWIEPAEPLAVGKTIQSGQLVVRRGPRFPFGPAPLDSLDLAVGREPVRTISPGEPIYPSMLVMPKEVKLGDKVAVEVWSGAARLAFEATAGSSGRVGDSIIVQNPENGRFFEARVEAKGKVSVRK